MALPKLSEKASSVIENMRDSAIQAAVARVEDCAIQQLFDSEAANALVNVIATALQATTLANLKVRISSQEIRDRIESELLNRLTNRILEKINDDIDAVATAICSELIASVTSHLSN